MYNSLDHDLVVAVLFTLMYQSLDHPLFIPVRAVSSTSSNETPVVVSPGGHIKSGALDLTVPGEVQDDISDPNAVQGQPIIPVSNPSHVKQPLEAEKVENEERQSEEPTTEDQGNVMSHLHHTEHMDNVQSPLHQTGENENLLSNQTSPVLPQPQYSVTFKDNSPEKHEVQYNVVSVKEEPEVVAEEGTVEHQQVGQCGLKSSAQAIGEIRTLEDKTKLSVKRKDTETANEEYEEAKVNPSPKKQRSEITDDVSGTESGIEEEEKKSKSKPKVKSAGRRPKRKTYKKR